MEGANVVYEGMGRPPREGFLKRKIEDLKARWSVDKTLALKVDRLQQEIGREFTEEEKQQVSERLRGEMKKQVVGNMVKDGVVATILATTAIVLAKNPGLRGSISFRMAEWTVRGGESASGWLGRSADKLKGGNWFKRQIAKMAEGAQGVVKAGTRAGERFFEKTTVGASNQTRKAEHKAKTALKKFTEEATKKHGATLPEGVAKRADKLKEVAQKASDRHGEMKGKFFTRVTSPFDKEDTLIVGPVKSMMEWRHNAQDEAFLAKLMRQGKDAVSKTAEAAEKAYNDIQAKAGAKPEAVQAALDKFNRARRNLQLVLDELARRAPPVAPPAT